MAITSKNIYNVRMNNNKTLLAGLGFILGPIHSIGVPGQQGFGVGYYGGSSSILSEMGLTPLDGCYYINHPNYGNYQHTNQSIMCCIPAFCYRLGRSSAPSYSCDGANALEIKDASEFPQFAHGSQFNGNADFGDGWILHRAFIDGGKMKNCFFMDKYLCSNNGNGQAASIKNADWLMCGDKDYSFFTLAVGGDGRYYDAITLSRARGDYYSLTTAYQWSAMSMLSLAHGQAATSTDYCAWYDPTNMTNFPKGATINYMYDVDDSEIVYAKHACAIGPRTRYGKTGSSNYPARVAHNGQLSGIMDVSGMGMQQCIGAYARYPNNVGLMKLSVSAHDIINQDTAVDDNLHDLFKTGFDAYFDKPVNFFGLRNGTSGASMWSACGIIPTSTKADPLFGNDEYYEGYYDLRPVFPLICSRGYSGATNSATSKGIFCRSFGSGSNLMWSDRGSGIGFRVAGYVS